LGLLLAALFIVLNGFFVAAEFAFVKLHATQSILEARVRRGERSAIHAKTILTRLDSYLSVTQFGVTLSSLGLGWMGEPAVEHLLEKVFAKPPTAESSPAAHAALIAASFGVLTLVHVLFGELVPKLVAIQRSEATALVSSTALRAIHISFRPLLWVLDVCSSLILRAMGLRADVSEGTLTEEEILGVLAASTARMPKGKEKAELVSRVLRFSERTARHAMVPRVDVVFLPIETSHTDALALVRSQGYSRVPLTRKRALDDVVGYLYAKDLLGDVSSGSLESLRRDVLFVPESQSLLDVLRAMQKEQSHIAVVVDEYGGTSGIVTLEDLLEEIVGEIRDESDEESATINKLGEGTFDVDPRVTLDELARVGLVYDDSADAVEPIGSVVLSATGRLPRVGDRAKIARNGQATITGVSRRRITRVRVEIEPEPVA
jgi:CBS domain containing-hemolysin-like protein